MGAILDLDEARAAIAVLPPIDWPVWPRKGSSACTGRWSGQPNLAVNLAEGFRMRGSPRPGVGHSVTEASCTDTPNDEAVQDLAIH